MGRPHREAAQDVGARSQVQERSETPGSGTHGLRDIGPDRPGGRKPDLGCRALGLELRLSLGLGPNDHAGTDRIGGGFVDEDEAAGGPR